MRKRNCNCASIVLEITYAAAAAQETDGTHGVNCMEAAGYNLILRPQYMLLVPRGKKNFANTVNVNSFGKLLLEVFLNSCLLYGLNGCWVSVARGVVLLSM